MRESFSRIRALVHKEFLQIIRDNSTFLIGAVLPIILILLIGYGITLDVTQVPMAVVWEDTSPTARQTLDFIYGSEYFKPVEVTSMQEGERLMAKRVVNAILVVPSDFTSNLQEGTASLQLVLYGVDASTSMTVQGYVEGNIQQYNVAVAMEKLSAALSSTNVPTGMVTIQSRMWFNDANTSAWYFVPGLLVLIMTVVGTFLTALVMAKEWERGTLESIFVTPVRREEIILSKVIPYFLIAMIGFLLCLLIARFLYGVPVRGSLLIIFVASSLYLFVMVGLGLLISAVTKNQFVSAQLSFLISFLPAMMLSGFIFDLRSIPDWVAVVSRILPPTYYLELLKSLLLAGNDWRLIGKNITILLCYSIFFMIMAWVKTKKRV